MKSFSPDVHLKTPQQVLIINEAKQNKTQKCEVNANEFCELFTRFVIARCHYNLHIIQCDEKLCFFIENVN